MDLVEISKVFSQRAARRAASEAEALTKKKLTAEQVRRARNKTELHRGLAYTADMATFGGFGYIAGREKGRKEATKVEKGINPFKPMVDKEAMHTAQERISEAHRAPSAVERVPTARTQWTKGAKVGAGAAGAVGGTAAIAGGIWAARKVAQRRAAAAMEAVEHANKTKKLADIKRAAVIGGGLAATGVAAPSAYAAYNKHKGG